MAQPSQALVDGVKDLLETGLFSDLTIKSGDRAFKVHKAILYAQSTYFRKLLGGRFTEATATEVELPEHPYIVCAMIHYFYNFACPKHGTEGTGISRPLYFVYVYQLADKYDVPGLAKEASSLLSNHFQLQRILDERNLLKSSFIETINAIEKCCRSDDLTLWEALVPAIKRNITRCLQDETFKQLVREKETLMVLLLQPEVPQRR